MRHLAAVLVLAAGLLPSGANAAPPQNYAIDVDFGTQVDDTSTPLGSGHLTGNILTDGTLGVLAGANILSWSFTYSIPTVYSFSIDSAGVAGSPSFQVNGNILSASSTDMTVVGAAFPSDFAEFLNATYYLNISRTAANANNNILLMTLPSDSPIAGDQSSVVVARDTSIGRAYDAEMPEPATLSLAGAWLAGAGLLRWHRRRRRTAASSTT